MGKDDGAVAANGSNGVNKTSDRLVKWILNARS